MLYIVGYCFCMIFAWGIFHKTWSPPNKEDKEDVVFYELRYIVAGLLWPFVACFNIIIAPIFRSGSWIGDWLTAREKAKELRLKDKELERIKVLLELKAAEKELAEYTISFKE